MPVPFFVFSHVHLSHGVQRMSDGHVSCPASAATSLWCFPSKVSHHHFENKWIYTSISPLKLAMTKQMEVHRIVYKEELFWHSVRGWVSFSSRILRVWALCVWTKAWMFLGLLIFRGSVFLAAFFDRQSQDLSPQIHRRNLRSSLVLGPGFDDSV